MTDLASEARPEENESEEKTPDERLVAWVQNEYLAKSGAAKDLAAAAAAFSGSYGESLRAQHSGFDGVFAGFLNRKDLQLEHKTNILAALTRTIDGAGLNSSGIAERKTREKLVAGIIDNLGDVHGIDQGSFPTCTTAAREEQHYSAQGGGNPFATVYIANALAELALTGQLREIDSGFGSGGIIRLSQDELKPDWEARHDQGKDDYRNFASQIFHTVARKDHSVRHSALIVDYLNDFDETPERRAQNLADLLEKQSATTIDLGPDSKFNQVLAGSSPFYKNLGHVVSIYRQKDADGKAEFKDGKALYFVSDQRGKALDMKNLTQEQLAKIFEKYEQPLEKLAELKPSPLSGEQKRFDYYFSRLKDLSRRQSVMIELGEWK